MTRHFATITLAALFAAPLALAPIDAQQGNQDRGGTSKLHRKGARAIPNQYIVVLEDDGTIARGDHAAVLGRMNAVLRGRGAVPEHVYADAIRGFSAFMSVEDALAIAADPSVDFVEQDSIMHTTVTQTNATWGLDRVDQRDRPLNGTYVYTSTGATVTAYVIDTGIRRTHTQFGGRAVHGFTAINDGRGSTDCNGHGTHVAGTIGGGTYGVAKSVRLIAVRVLSCSGSGSTSGVIAGVNFVSGNHAGTNPAVANMSLGGGASSALDTAVSNSIADGISYAVAAGNSNANASSFSPARVGAAITVGSSTSTDARSSFSNFGSVVDIFAPGSSITSAWSTGDTAIRTISGTSMATPHVAGVAARYLQGNPGASPATVRNALVAAATTNGLSGLPSSTANRLLFRAGVE
jgi:subtilisin family serine protease